MKRENKRIAIFLGHPAHFHLFKNAANNLQAKGYEVMFLIKRKDVLEQLVQNAGYNYVVIRDVPRQKTDKLSLILSVLEMDWRAMTFLWKYRPKLYIGTCGFWTSVLYGCPFISCNEDDADVVPRFAMLAYPTANAILTPDVCDCGRWNKKAIKYPSYHELAYLHPNNFTPDRQVVERYGIDTRKPYFIVRFASLNAHHDGGIRGITTDIAQHIIDLLKPYGNIYITSERPLEPQFEEYRIRINPLDMHHVMAFSSLYIGDSQTMAAEAGVLGVPFIRFNDFVGRIGYLRDLEDHYRLGYGIKASEAGSADRMYQTITELLSKPNLHEVWQQRQENMLKDKIDYAKFLTWFIENYPESRRQVQDKTYFTSEGFLPK